jgi:hypothetical protein
MRNWEVITEDQLEQLSLDWYRETCWAYRLAETLSQPKGKPRY